LNWNMFANSSAPGKPNAAVGGGANGVVADLLAESAAQTRGHVRAGQMVAGHSDAPPDPGIAVAKDAVGAGADVGGGNARELGGAERQSDRQHPALITSMPNEIMLSQ
jgi:hypothetical protein